MTTPDPAATADAGLLAALDAATTGLDMDGAPLAEAEPVSIADRRRSRGQPRESRLVRLTLTSVDGVLRWEEGPPPRVAGRRALRPGAPGLGGEVVRDFAFAELPPSQVTGFLDTLDGKLTPLRGLRRWRDGTLTAVDRPKARSRRTLLFVHGTFSRAESVLDPLASTPEGQRFLDRAAAAYDEILAFDHATLAVGPALNALDLARAMAGAGQVDVICHSRGGLVVRWWLHAFGGAESGVRRVVFVGSPLAGTSLAAAPRLKGALELLTNVGKVFAGAAATASLGAPLLAGAAGLMKVLVSITGLGARTPLADAAVAMVPGLAAQARVGNNHELRHLRAGVAAGGPALYAVRANFEPRDPAWAFWRHFTRPGQVLLDWGADRVFDGPNDLVVDTESMTSLGDAVAVPARHLLDFGATDRVHHCNYFSQPETAAFLRKVLKV